MGDQKSKKYKVMAETAVADKPVVRVGFGTEVKPGAKVLTVSSSEAQNNFGKYRKAAAEGDVVIVKKKDAQSILMISPDTDWKQVVMNMPIDPELEALGKIAKGLMTTDEMVEQAKDEYFREKYGEYL